MVRPSTGSGRGSSPCGPRPELVEGRTDTEGGRAALSHAFSVLKADHAVSVIHPDNDASIRVAKRLGASFERTMTLCGSEVRIYRINNPKIA